VIITPFNLRLPAPCPSLRSLDERFRPPYLGTPRLETVLRQFPYPTDSYELGLPKLLQGSLIFLTRQTADRLKGDSLGKHWIRPQIEDFTTHR
jgi:hypothetical protein